MSEISDGPQSDDQDRQTRDRQARDRQAQAHDLIDTLGDKYKVIFLVDQSGDSSEIVATATALAQSFGLNRWAGWSVAGIGVDGNAMGTTAVVNVETVLKDLADTGRSTGVILYPLEGFIGTASSQEHVDHAAQVAQSIGLDPHHVVVVSVTP